MNSKILFILLVLLLTLKFSQSQGQSPTCPKYAFQTSNMANKTSTPSFKACVDLPLLNSFLHWTYSPATTTLDIAYRHTGLSSATSKWVAWAINPTGKGMIGAQCLVAHHNPTDGSMVAYTSPVSGYSTKLTQGDLSFKVTQLSAVGLNNEIIIFATLEVPGNATVLNQLWQDGPLSSDGSPLIHSTSGPNLQSTASLNLLSGVAAPTGGANISPLKNIHGVLNAVSWGILMPTGAIIARYMRVFPAADPAWFYLHVGCQISAYAIGAAGWATGLNLGSQSKGIQHSSHRNIGITLFCLATLQMFALLIRPIKEHKYRPYWNVYHHSVGYTIIILSIVNILEGIKILDPIAIWKKTYVGVILALALLAAFLEVFTWYIVFRRKKAQAADNTNRHGLHAPIRANFA
ncbi:hypothetical protein RND81_07G116300 [Saponaria officinalis]|uniref:Cytochrome b561 and DOMON domain-containing protein n=1 Tax=Saponaria officinalis TaxID=3572 RepID=A0AAW1JPV0_SAPOF